MLKLRPLPDELQKIAIAELNEVPERLADDIEALKIWIEKQPHLKARTDDQFLVGFLRGCKFSLEKAKSKIERYYTLRTLYPDFYTIRDVDDPRLLELIRVGVGLHLPTPLHGNGPRIALIRTGAYPPDKFSFSDVMCMANGLLSISILEDDYALVNGVITILDMAELTMQHMAFMTPGTMKKMSAFAEEAMPLREKSVHIINTPAGWEPIFNTLKPLMPAKQQERLYVHGNKMEALYEHVPQKWLPKEYGGENGSISEIIAAGEATFIRFKEYIRDENNYGTNESLRPTASKQYGLFGVDGSFRQLNVD